MSCLRRPITYIPPPQFGTRDFIKSSLESMFSQKQNTNRICLRPSCWPWKSFTSQHIVDQELGSKSETMIENWNTKKAIGVIEAKFLSVTTDFRELDFGVLIWLLGVLLTVMEIWWEHNGEKIRHSFCEAWVVVY